MLTPGTWTIANNLSVPTTINLWVTKGADVVINSGRTLTLNSLGIFERPDWYSGAGTAVFNFHQWPFTASFVRLRCDPAVPASSLTIVSFPCDAFVKDGNATWPIHETGISIIVPDSPTVWLGAYREVQTGSNAPAGWTGVSGSHYIFQASATEPVTCGGCITIAQVTVAGSVITAIDLSWAPADPVGHVVNVMDPQFGITGDGITDDTVGFQAALNAAARKTLFVPEGDYIITASLTLPRSIRITGATRRGNGTGPGLASIGTYLIANFAGPVFIRTSGPVETADILIEHMNIQGDRGTYGAGNGITLTNLSDVVFRNIVITAFGTDNIHIDGGTHHYFRDVFSSNAGTSNLHVENETLLSLIQYVTDIGANSLRLITVSGYNILSSHFEGASIAGINATGDVSGRIEDSFFTQAPTAILFGTGSQPRRSIILGNDINCDGSGSSIGIDLSNTASLEIQVADNRVIACDMAIRSRMNSGSITGNLFYGLETGMDITPSAVTIRPIIIANNYAQGDTNSILHNSGDNALYVGNITVSQNGSFRPMVITAGVPEVYAKPYAVRAGLTGVQSIPNNAWTSVGWNIENYDTKAMHDNSTNPSRFIAVSPGRYTIRALVTLVASAAGNFRGVRLRVDGAAVIAENTTFVDFSTGGGTTLLLTTDWDFPASSYVEVQVIQDTGGAINLLTVSHASLRHN